jgi:transcriptional regulator with XRE-family HTH domain
VGSQYRNDKVITNLGIRIREVRVKVGLSQQRLADLCQLELSQINRIELGKVNTSVSQLFLIAENLGVQVEELLKFKK